MALFINIKMCSSCFLDLKKKRKTPVSKHNSCSKCEKMVIVRRVWSNKFASNRGEEDALCTQRAAGLKNECCSVRRCSQQFQFQLWGSRAVACCSPYPGSLSLLAPLSTIEFHFTAHLKNIFEAGPAIGRWWREGIPGNEIKRN